MFGDEAISLFTGLQLGAQGAPLADVPYYGDHLERTSIGVAPQRWNTLHPMELAVFRSHALFAVGAQVQFSAGNYLFPEALHALATWWDVIAVAKASEKFDAKMLAEVEKFMHDPAGWSKAHGGVAKPAAE